MTTDMAMMDNAAVLERVVVGGNLAELKPAERMMYYKAVCESVGLNPLTKPFEYLTLKNRLVLYARRDCTEQLRRIHRVAVAIVAREVVEGVYVVTAKASMADGRSDESIGAVAIDGLKGEANGFSFYVRRTSPLSTIAVQTGRNYRYGGGRYTVQVRKLL